MPMLPGSERMLRVRNTSRTMPGALCMWKELRSLVTMPAASWPRCCSRSSPSYSGWKRLGKRCGEQVGGEKRQHPAGKGKHLVHHPAAGTPADRQQQHDDDGDVEPAHPDLVVTVPGCRPSPFSCSSAFSAASFVGNGPARTRVRLPFTASV